MKITYIRAALIGAFISCIALTANASDFGDYVWRKALQDKWLYDVHSNDAAWLKENGYAQTGANLPSNSTKPLPNSAYDLSLNNGAPEVRTRTPFQFSGAPKEIADVRAKFKIGELGAALGRFANKVFAPLAIGSALWDLARELGYYVERNPDGTVKVEKDGYDQSNNPYFVQTNPVTTSTDMPSLCLLITDRGVFSYLDTTTSIYGNITGRCHYVGGAYVTILRCPIGQQLVGQSCQLAQLSRIPSSLPELQNAIDGKTNWSPSSRILDAIRDAISNEQDPTKQPKTDEPKVSGPASSSPTSTTTTTGDTITTTTVTTNYNYTNNQISSTTNTTQNTYNTTNNTTTTTTTVNNQTKPEEPKDPCEGKTDRVGCLDIDTPTDEIPKDNKNITYAPETPLAANGTCPAPMTMQVFGTSLTLSYASICTAASDYMRPILLLLASFAAALIVVRTLRE